MSEVDNTKDYYKALGLTSEATTEEIKAAYIQLALKYHPDTNVASVKSSGSSDVQLGSNNANEEFIRISEAWSVLSKADVRQRYDLMRSDSIRPSSNSSGLGNYTSEVSSTYNTQKTAYHKSVKQKASSNWEDLRDKYKCEKWQNLPLAQKKISRARPLNSFGGSLIGVALPVLIVAGSVVYYKYSLYS